MWDYDVEECAELGHEYEESNTFDNGEPGYIKHCTWCGITEED